MGAKSDAKIQFEAVRKLRRAFEGRRMSDRQLRSLQRLFRFLTWAGIVGYIICLHVKLYLMTELARELARIAGVTLRNI